MSTPEVTDGTGPISEDLARKRVMDLNDEERKQLPMAVQIGLRLAKEPVFQQLLYAGTELKEALAAELGLDADSDEDKDKVGLGLKVLQREGSLSYEATYVPDTYKDFSNEEHEDFMLRIRPVLGPKFQNVFFGTVEAIQEKFSSIEESL